MTKIMNIFSLQKKTITIILLVIIALLLDVIQFVILPSRRTGPLGIGLPAEMKEFHGKYSKFNIKYPESWVLFERPQGNPDDKDVIAVIVVPGRSWPDVLIEARDFSNGSIKEVAEWGETKSINLDGYESSDLISYSTPDNNWLLREYTWESESSIIGIVKIIEIKCNDYYLFNNGIGYMLAFCAEEKHWPTVENVFKDMIESFSLE